MVVASIARVSPANEAVRYLSKRIESDHYRGVHQSQHNRYNLDRLDTILRLLKLHSGGGRLKIRTQDLSKRPHNVADEAEYAAFCDEAKRLAGVGTQDAMRKNFFVDFDRMGLIHRFNSRGNLIPPGARSSTTHVSISALGDKLVQANALQKRFAYSAAIDRLLGGTIDVLLDVMAKAGTRKLTVFEYMLFVSAVGADDSIQLTRDEAASMVLSFRALSPTQQTALIDSVQDYARPGNFKGEKTFKRDFSNWKNESDQIFSLLDQTVYFERRFDASANSPSELVLRSDKNSPVTARRMARSLTEKLRYFENHKVVRTLGFELHHVVGLGSSESLEHFKILDDWRNLVYVDAFSHAKITQSGNQHVVLTFQGAVLRLSRIGAADDRLEFHRPKNVLYADSRKSVMVEYNQALNGL